MAKLRTDEVGSAEPPEPEPEPMIQIPTKRVVMVNPLSKGNLGKTTFYEYVVTCLQQSGITWQGVNMDNRHLAFQEAHPRQVRNLFEEGVAAVDEYQPVFAEVRRSDASVFLIDQRAQADLAFIQSARDIGFLQHCQDDGVRIIPIAFAINDLDYIQNLDDTVVTFADEGIKKWLVVSHPVYKANDMFMKTSLMKFLHESGAVVVTMPWLSKLTMARYTAVNASSTGPVSFLAAMDNPFFSALKECKTELHRAVVKLAKQFYEHSSYLLPDGKKFASMEDIRTWGWDLPATGESLAAEGGRQRRAGLSETFST